MRADELNVVACEVIEEERREHARRARDAVPDARARGEADAQAGFERSPAEVGLLEVEEVALIQQPDALERLARHQHARAVGQLALREVVELPGILLAVA